MLEHGSDSTPPEFEFKMVKKFRDSLSRQIAEAILIQEKGTLNQKNEFGANFLCRLEPAGSSWEEEREQAACEREKRIMESNIKEFISVMSNVYELNKIKSPSSNDIHTSRHSLTRRKREKQLVPDTDASNHLGAKRRRMNHQHSTPNNIRRNGGDEMLNDPELISPILANTNNTTSRAEIDHDSGTTDSSEASAVPVRARTNISDDLWTMRLGRLRERRNDSSTEMAISFLCLEEAANRRGLLPPRINRRMDWLDLEGINHMLEDIRIDEWSTGSLDIPETAPLKSPDIPRKPSEVSSKDQEECEGPLVPNDPQVSESVDVSLRTPKRKLSPTVTTPLGKGRKRTTSVNNSPHLRQRLELVGGALVDEQVEQGAPDLFHGIGRLILRPTPGDNLDTPGASNIDGQAPPINDLATDVDATTVRPSAIVTTNGTEQTQRVEKNLQVDEGSSNSVRPDVDIPTQGPVMLKSPQVSESGDVSLRSALLNRHRRRVGSDSSPSLRRVSRTSSRHRSNSLNLTGGFGRQRKITEIFQDQLERINKEESGVSEISAPEL